MVVDWCTELLRGGDWTDPEMPDLDWIGGRSSVAMVAKDLDLVYWPRVWAARALLHVYRPQAASAVVGGLTDESWRVREMCAKVARAHQLGEAAEALHGCCSDDVPRVRSPPYGRWPGSVRPRTPTPCGDCLDDPEREVAAAAERALREMSRRLDRPL